MLSKGQPPLLFQVLTPPPLPQVPEQGGCSRAWAHNGACPDPPAGLGAFPPWEGDLNWSAPANSSLPAWQCEDNAGQKYLCGWRKVNFSASVFFPGNRGHRQIQQNRSRHRVRRGPVGRPREPCPPHPLLPPAIWLHGGAGGGGDGGFQRLRIMASCNARAGWTLQHHLAQAHHGAFGQTGSSAEGPCPRSNSQLGLFRILPALREILRFFETLMAEIWQQLATEKESGDE